MIYFCDKHTQTREKIDKINKEKEKDKNVKYILPKSGKRLQMLFYVQMNDYGGGAMLYGSLKVSLVMFLYIPMNDQGSGAVLYGLIENECIVICHWFKIGSLMCFYGNKL